MEYVVVLGQAIRYRAFGGSRYPVRFPRNVRFRVGDLVPPEFYGRSERGRENGRREELRDGGGDDFVREMDDGIDFCTEKSDKTRRRRFFEIVNRSGIDMFGENISLLFRRPHRKSLYESEC